jgi:hypothetical protein
VVVVESEQGALAVADLEEAHDVPFIGGVLAGRLAALDRGRDSLDDDGRLEVRGRAGLRERQVGGVAEREDVRPVADAERVAVGREPAARRGREARVDDQLLALVGGTRMSRSYGSSSPSRLRMTLRSGSIASTLKNVCSSTPFSSKIGVAMSETLWIVNARPIGEQKWTSLVSRRPRSRSSDSMRKDTSSGAGGHL